MIDIVADLHLHGKYSRAVSPQMTLPVMAEVGRGKGINLLATGDWTHPLWFREIRNSLEEAEEGLLKIKGEASRVKGEGEKDVRFMLSVEISCIYSQDGKGRRIHNLVFTNSFSHAEKINRELTKRGCNLSADGRPIIGLSSKNLLEIILEIDERNMLIPAHIWTPWFGIYGQASGFNSLEEAFGELAPKVYGIETGLSSDPEMNWQIGELDTRSILSFSDAHSLAKMGREMTVFRLENLSYENIRKAVMAPSGKSQIPTASWRTKSQEDNKVLYTVEFYPEEGKYHYSGHRNCKVTLTPEEQYKVQNICPVCKRKVTDGVMRRVKEISERKLKIKDPKPKTIKEKSENGLVWLRDPRGIHPPFVRLVPLIEIIAEAIGSPVTSPKAVRIFNALVEKLESELYILLKADIKAIERAALGVGIPEKAKRVAEGIQKVREAHIVIIPGFDGVYGTVKIWPSFAVASEGQEMKEDKENTKPQSEQVRLDF